MAASRRAIGVESGNVIGARQFAAWRTPPHHVDVNRLFSDPERKSPLLRAPCRQVGDVGVKIHVNESLITRVLQLLMALAEIEASGKVPVAIEFTGVHLLFLHLPLLRAIVP